MKNKQLQKWALGAEIVSAIAVIATIGFLAFQTMENTNALQAQTFQALMRDTFDWRATVNEPNNMELRAKWFQEGYENLTQIEQLQIRGNDLLLWGIYESAYFANERRVLGSEEWTRFKVAICRNYKRDEVFWDYEGMTSFSELLTPQFMRFIVDTCI